jgi:hypothetical protein
VGAWTGAVDLVHGSIVDRGKRVYPDLIRAVDLGSPALLDLELWASVLRAEKTYT